MFIRFFADTTGSALSIAALEYMRSFMRVAPVRLVSVTGVLAGRWQAYGQLISTPMTGELLNAVCADPSRWTWIQKVDAGASPIDHRAIAPGADLAVPQAVEHFTGRVELHTASARRNVLFAYAPPRDKAQAETALKYDAIVVPNHTVWRQDNVVVSPMDTVVLPVPVVDHQAMRDLFLPPEPRT